MVDVLSKAGEPPSPLHLGKVDRRGVLGAATAATLGATMSAHPAGAQAADRTVLLIPSTGASDQIPIIQGAMDRLELTGGGRIDLGSYRFTCLSGPLRVDPTRTTLVGAGAVLDFSGRQIATNDPRCILIIPKA